MVSDIVRAHPEPAAGLAGREQALGGPDEPRELPGEPGMGQTLDGRHAAMLDGAALEERWEVLHWELVEASRVCPKRLEVEPCQVPTQVPGPWTALGTGCSAPDRISCPPWPVEARAAITEPNSLAAGPAGLYG